MPQDRESRYVRRGASRAGVEPIGRGEYGAEYEGPYAGGFRGYGMGYRGGALRSRGSYEAGQLRSGLNPVDEFEFEWGGGYVGGRGYGGTNYDYEHGYQTGARGRYAPSMRGVPPRPRRPTSPATRGGYSWSEYEYGEPLGPARYGYGPYHHRLRRRRRSDEEIRADVEEALFYDTWVDADRIQVEVEDGVVTLRGTLASFDEIRYATDDAWDVDGVRGVRTELEVEPSAWGGTEGEVERESRGRGAEAELVEAGGGDRGEDAIEEGPEEPASSTRETRTTRSRMAGRTVTARTTPGGRAAGGGTRRSGRRKAADGGAASAQAAQTAPDVAAGAGAESVAPGADAAPQA
jgi:hypothetical protein